MDIVPILNQFGLPVAILMAVGFGLWRGIIFFGTKIAEPVTQSVIENYKVQNACTQKMTDTLTALEMTTSKIANQQSDFVKVQKQIADVQSKHLEFCKNGHTVSDTPG